MPKVLVVDDESEVVEVVCDALKEAGFESLSAGDGTSALSLIDAHQPDVVILDVRLPGVPGLDVCREIRRRPKSATLPVIMLTSKVEEEDRIAGLEVGADDYVVKPFNDRELIARVRAVLRRATQPPPSFRRAGDLELDGSKRLVTVNGSPVALTATEFAILARLMGARGALVSREQLFETIWGEVKVADSLSRRLDMHMSHLRKKLAAEGQRVVTLRGTGFRFDMGPGAP